MLTLDLATGGSPPSQAGAQEVNSWRDERGEICARLYKCGTQRWIDWAGLGVFGFEPGARSVKFWPAPGARSDVIADCFARILQPAILQVLGCQALHASAVVAPEGVWAFCGVAQSGKSTLAYALAKAGLPHFADDALVMSLQAGEVVAHPLPFAPRLRPSTRHHFSRDSAVDEEWRTLPMRTATPVAAFFVLRQNRGLDGRTQLSRLPAARAFSELLTHAHCFDFADSNETRRIIDDYLETATRIPVFSLTYQPGFDRLPELLDLIRSAGRSAAGERQPAGAAQ